MPRVSTFQLCLSLVILLLCLIGWTHGEGECMPSEPLMCYHCDSLVDRRCRDPFNKTFHNEDTIKPCKGCCVKMVQKYNTPDERILRLCTRDLEVRLFMIDHVCMSEHDKSGHMCFCEHNLCNAGSVKYTNRALYSSILFSILIFVLIY